MSQTSAKKQKDNSSQYTNIIGIDPSTTCTGLCVNGEMTAIMPRSHAETKKGALQKWVNITSCHADIITVDNRPKSKVYSDEEILKLAYYRELRDNIGRVIESKDFIPTDTLVLIEGFSYESAKGHLIDLVAFSTLLRNYLVEAGYNIQVIAPSTLKMNTAKMAYEPTTVYLNKKKTRSKIEWRNPKGLSGGSFKKPDMMNAIIDSKYTDSKWKKFLQEHLSDLNDMKNVPKPIEDLNDAFLLYKVHKNGFSE